MNKFRLLLSEHVGTAFQRQLAFADFLGNRDWSVDLQTGRVTFGGDLEFPLQLLGSEAHGLDTWMWSWANESISPHPDAMVDVNRLRELGQEQHVEELVTPELPISEAQGHEIALLASGLNGQCCDYRGPYEGGAAFFLVTEVPVLLLKPWGIERVLRVIPEVIATFEVDHRIMVESYLAQQDFEFQPGAEEIVSSRGGDSITVSFDELGRICNIGGHIQSRKPWWKFWK